MYAVHRLELSSPRINVDGLAGNGATEPILIPKIRIRFADFPYFTLLDEARGYSPRRPDADISTARPV